MSAFVQTCSELEQDPKRWLVTGAAGFIGSSLVEKLLSLGQQVVGLDNFSTGHRHNLAELSGLQFIEGDVTSADVCAAACRGVDFVLHQAALGSVPRSIETPILSHQSNVNGFLNMLVAARDVGARFVYASSSSVYGDHPGLPKREDAIGEPLSPYAATKRIDEIYADVFARCYGTHCVGLRYFNVFGRRQDPNGAYAAVIPRWIEHLFTGKHCVIYGDGSHSRDFCYVDNAVQANILAATTRLDQAASVFNVGCGDETDLNALFHMLSERVHGHTGQCADATVQHTENRPGDVPHSLADISAIEDALGYAPSHQIAEGLDDTVDWYATHR